MIERGSYVNFETDKDGDLVISLAKGITKKARKEFMENTSECDADTRFMELIDDFLCNVWTWVYPEDIGALTSAPIISREVKENEDGDVVDVGIVYSYDMYAIYDPVQEIFSEGKIVLTKNEPEDYNDVDWVS